MARLLRSGVVLLVALVLQVGLFTEVRVTGVAPDLLLLCAVAAGLVGGANEGAGVGFVAGLLMDVWLSTPFGMSALAFSIVGYGVGSMVESGIRAEGPLAVGYCTAWSAAGVSLFATVAWLTGQPGVWTSELPRIVVVCSLLNALFSPLALLGMRWAVRSDGPRSPASLRMVN